MNAARTAHTADRLSVLAFLWAMATISHHMAFPWWFDRYTVLNLALVGTALLVLVRPRSVPFFALLAALGLINVVKLAPEHPNHMLLEGFGDMIVISAVILRGLRGARAGERLWRGWSDLAPVERDRLFESLAAPMRVSLLVLYVWSVVHKLNWDFITADVSCGPVLLQDLLARHALPAAPGWLREASVWGTLLIEAGIPLMLLGARTRAWGLGLALVFHFVLAQHGLTGLYSFTSTMLAMLFLFTPPAFTEAIGRHVGRLRTTVGVHRRPAFGLAVMLIMIAGAAVGAGEESRRLLWNVWALIAIGVYARWAWISPGAFAIERPFSVEPAVLWVFPLLLLLNGASPYLGLKTHTSFSMFSNLRTEGGRTNHMFLGRAALASWQDDLVEIIDSDLPVFRKARDERMRLPFFRFRRHAGTAGGDFQVLYRRNGETRTLSVRDGKASDPEAGTPPPWWLRKILYFRDVDPEGPTRCWN